LSQPFRVATCRDTHRPQAFPKSSRTFCSWPPSSRNKTNMCRQGFADAAESRSKPRRKVIRTSVNLAPRCRMSSRPLQNNPANDRPDLPRRNPASTVLRPAAMSREAASTYGDVRIASRARGFQSLCEKMRVVSGFRHPSGMDSLLGACSGGGRRCAPRPPANFLHRSAVLFCR
jgi:hypothetical protein